ncbi:MAG: hypothetical protein RMJ38_04010 [candidate division WOR-3 bacterium]|nr:hypothetical protein [candidate division WOR-3 bacterium]MDW8150586.1 hypothetical protein [candidate division WOR-3 bacterium]
MIDTILVKVIDLYTQTPIQDAFVKSSINYAYTDSLGIAKILLNRENRIVYVSHLNYHEKYIEVPMELKEIDVALEYKDYILNEIVVSSPYEFSDKPQSIIKKLDIYITPGSAADVFRVIKDLPSSSGIEDVGILEVRGGKYYENVILVNNVRIVSPFIEQTPAGGLFSFIRTDFIKKVDFYPGGLPSNFGGGTSAINIELEDNIENNSFGIGIGHIDLSLKFLNSAVAYNYSNPILLYKLNGFKDVGFSDYPSIHNFQIFSPNFYNFIGFFVNEFYTQENFRYNSNKYGFLLKRRINLSSLSFGITNDKSNIGKFQKFESILNTNFVNYFNEIAVGIEGTYRKFSYSYDTLYRKSKNNLIGSVYSIFDFEIYKIKANPSFRFDITEHLYFQPRLNLSYNNFRFSSGYYYIYYEFERAYDFDIGYDVEFRDFDIKSDIFYKKYVDSLYEVHGFELLIKNKSEPMFFSYSLYKKNNIEHSIGFSYSYFYRDFQIGTKLKFSTENYFRVDLRLSKVGFNKNNDLFGIYVETLNITNRENLIDVGNNRKIKLIPRTTYIGLFYVF